MNVSRFQYGWHLAAILNIKLVFRIFQLLNSKLLILSNHLCFRRYAALYITKIVLLKINGNYPLVCLLFRIRIFN